MNAKGENLRNGVNRWSNCDVANLGKAVEAAQSQIEAIRRLEKNAGLDSLPDKLRETARLRIENPELSLAQLAALAEVSKSCLNHRLRKLVELANAPVQVPGETRWTHRRDCTSTDHKEVTYGFFAHLHVHTEFPFWMAPAVLQS